MVLYNKVGQWLSTNILLVTKTKIVKTRYCLKISKHM